MVPLAPLVPAPMLPVPVVVAADRAALRSDDCSSLAAERWLSMVCPV